MVLPGVVAIRGDFRHQYTPTSYADSLRQLINPFLITLDIINRLRKKKFFLLLKHFTPPVKYLVEEKTCLHLGSPAN